MIEEQNLSTGSVPKKLIVFAFPVLLANLLQSLYSIVDMLVVGRIVGETGLAAISNASMLSFIISSICIGVTMGGTVLIAQFKGADDTDGQRETIGTLFSLAILASVVKNGVLYLRICCGVNSLIYAVMYTFDSFAIGVGSANIALVNALLEAVIVRLPVSWLLAFPLNVGFTGVYLGQALSPILPAIVGFLYFKGKGWESKKLIKRRDVGGAL